MRSQVAPAETFAARARSARRVLLCDPAPLGDALHGVVAARAIAARLPQARIDVLSVAGSEPLWHSVPGVDRVFAVQWHPRLADKALMRSARRVALKAVATTRYDALIDLKPSDRSVPFVMAARAPLRLGVRDFSYGLRHRWLYTHLADAPWRDQSLYRYQLDLLALAGFDDAGMAKGPRAFTADPAPAGLTGVVHLSFCATASARELPLAVERELLRMLCESHPAQRFVTSCAPGPREKRRIAAIVEGLAYPNLTVRAGDLGLADLAALLRDACLHVGPDTGGLHLAWLQGTPTVSWFLNHEALMAWAPRGRGHQVLVSALEQSRKADHLHGISAARIAATVARQLAAPPGDRETRFEFCADGFGAPQVSTA